jgi:hypothetical protein
MLELFAVAVIILLALCAWLLWLCLGFLEQIRELSAQDLKRKFDLDYKALQKSNPELASSESKSLYDAAVERLIYPTTEEMAARRFSHRLGLTKKS